MRRAILITTCVTLGVIFNIGIAWGLCSARHSIGKLWSKSTQLEDFDAAMKGWPAAVPSDWGWPDYWAQTSLLGYTMWSVSNDARIDKKSGVRFRLSTVGHEVLVEDTGWPMRSLRSVQFNPFEGNWQGKRVTFVSWRVGIVVASPQPPLGTTLQYLPVRPLWLGSTVNVALHSAVIWIALVGLGRSRRWLRLRRGLCPACTYPIGASPICTECGNELAVSSTRAVRPHT